MTNLSASGDRPDLGDPGSLFVEEQRFAVVQEWVIDAAISDGAFRLYSLLLRYGNSSGCRMPSRALLARRLPPFGGYGSTGPCGSSWRRASSASSIATTDWCGLVDVADCAGLVCTMRRSPAGEGNRNSARLALIRCFAQLMRWPMVDSGTRNARATSAVGQSADRPECQGHLRGQRE